MSQRPFSKPAANSVEACLCACHSLLGKYMNHDHIFNAAGPLGRSPEQLFMVVLRPPTG